MAIKVSATSILQAGQAPSSSHTPITPPLHADPGLIGEVLAVVIAAITWGRDKPADFAGIAAACVAGGAAWLALKQHSPLTSAYRVAAAELALQASVLASVTEDQWPQAVADAEEAISREHTMWLASRGEEPLV